VPEAVGDRNDSEVTSRTGDARMPGAVWQRQWPRKAVGVLACRPLPWTSRELSSVQEEMLVCATQLTRLEPTHPLIQKRSVGHLQFFQQIPANRANPNHFGSWFRRQRQVCPLRHFVFARIETMSFCPLSLSARFTRVAMCNVT